MPTVITLLLGSRSCFSLVIARTWSLLCCNFCPGPVLRPNDSWWPGAFASPACSRGWWSAPLLRRWRCSHCLWNAVLGVLDEGPPQRERRRRGRGREKRRGARGLTFEQGRQEVMTQFSTWAVKHRTKKWKQRDRWRKWVERWCLGPWPWEISWWNVLLNRTRTRPANSFCIRWARSFFF